MCLFVKRKKNEAEATSKLIAVIQVLENRTIQTSPIIIKDFRMSY